MKPEDYCKKLTDWAKLYLESCEQYGKEARDEARRAFHTVDLAIRKSCLLDRMIYGGEEPSQTPCPVHKGKWSGIHFGWPGSRMFGPGHPPEGTPLPESEVSPFLRKWYDEGCRCFQHSCGCTTGWQPEPKKDEP